LKSTTKHSQQLFRAHATPRQQIRIPLSEREAVRLLGKVVRLLGKVKPTADMPRPGAAKKAKQKSAQEAPCELVP
jgi:hypothetical protein